MFSETKSPSRGEAGAGADKSAVHPGGGSAPMIHPCARSVKPANSDPARLRGQALANEERAASMAAWHRARAGRYLVWYDLPWCAAQYESHTAEAAYYDSLVARHRQIVAALGEVRP